MKNEPAVAHWRHRANRIFFLFICKVGGVRLICWMIQAFEKKKILSRVTRSFDISVVCDWNLQDKGGWSRGNMRKKKEKLC